MTDRLRIAFLAVAGLAFARCGTAQAFDVPGHGSPSFVVAGAYFPAWLVCSIIGIAAAILVRGSVVASGLSQFPPLQLLVCLSVGALAGSLAWIVWIGL